MSAHLRQLVAVVGMLLLAPIAARLVMGELTPLDAAIRSGALFAGVMIARRLANLAPGRPVVLVAASKKD